jgi:hypothetical protein
MLYQKVTYLSYLPNVVLANTYIIYLYTVTPLDPWVVLSIYFRPEVCLCVYTTKRQRSFVPDLILPLCFGNVGPSFE